MARILFLCDTFAPEFGGSEAILLDLARGAARAGHRVAVLVPAGGAPAVEQDAFDAGEPYRIVRSGAWGRLFRLGGSASGLASRLARGAIVPLVFSQAARLERPDLVVVGHAVPLGNVAAALKRLRGIPYILMTYGEEVTMYSRGGRMRGLLSAAIASADAVTCLTADSAAEIRALVPGCADPVVCPPPANPAIMRVAPDAVAGVREAHGLRGRQVMLTVSRLVARKGVDVTIRALGMLAPEFPQLAYLVVGDGPQRAELGRIAGECGVADRVVFAGRVPDTAPFYHACDVFVMPNRVMEDGEREGYGIVFAEAGMAAKPVIGGRTGGAVDAIDDGVTGLLVDPTDPEAVADALRRLLSYPELSRRMGEAGRARAVRDCTPEAALDRFMAVVDTVLRGGGADGVPSGARE